MTPPERGATLHPRNRHRGGLDFARLKAANPGLERFISINEWGNEALDFADPAAMKALNATLLKVYYGIEGWDIPPGYLCPSVPGRADYIHSLADLLAASNGGKVPRGPSVRALDIGTGANCVYPLIGQAEYGWSFVGTDIDGTALASAGRILSRNPAAPVELRLQHSPQELLSGVLRPGETFDVSLCNPPFHESAKAAAEGSRRKWKNLGRAPAAPLNFGGRGAELWCPGGEPRFVRRLIDESAREPPRCLWYSTLVSKSANLPAAERAVKAARAAMSRVIELRQGQKQSRILAWSFFDERGQREWWTARRGTGGNAG